MEGKDTKEEKRGEIRLSFYAFFSAVEGLRLGCWSGAFFGQGCVPCISLGFAHHSTGQKQQSVKLDLMGFDCLGQMRAEGGKGGCQWKIIKIIILKCFYL